MRDIPQVRTAPSKHASRATAWEPTICHHFGKQVSHMEPDSASMTAWICHRAVLSNWNDNLLEDSRLYPLMRKRMVPLHRTEPFTNVGVGGLVDQTEFEETSPTQHTQVQKGPGTANLTFPASALCVLVPLCETTQFEQRENNPCNPCNP
jgi:hypothetical protein